MEFISLYGLFLAKVITLLVALGALVAFVVSLGLRKGQTRGELQLKNIGEQYHEMQHEMRLARLGESEQKQWLKQQKKQDKADAAAKKQRMKSGTIDAVKPCMYVIDFKGSMDAHEVNGLREEVSAVLAVATSQDEVLLRLESPGGVVHGYGLAASQLQRIRSKGIPLTVTVDKVAASGGYMMACVADKIVAAPFAILGSIGVIAQIPNFNRLLKKNDIDVELHTAGAFKRTLTLFGENTQQGREKFREELNETHELFKQFVQQQRPVVDIDAVATGEHWFGIQAKEKALVDEISTSDDVLIAAIDTHEVISVRYRRPKRFIERFTGSAAHSLDRLLLRWWQRGEKPLL